MIDHNNGIFCPHTFLPYKKAAVAILCFDLPVQFFLLEQIPQSNNTIQKYSNAIKNN